MSRHYEDIEAIYQRPARSDGLMVMGIDPGPTHSAYALVREDYRLVAANKGPIEIIYNELQMESIQQVIIESLQSYGMPVGRSVFETAYTIGKLLRECERLGIPTTLCCRQEYARAICGTTKISDAILKQALELRFGGYGKGEPLELLRGNSDKRSAFAVAAYYLDCQRVALCHDLPLLHTRGRGQDQSAENTQTFESGEHAGGRS